jgi:hypothetical protein
MKPSTQRNDLSTSETADDHGAFMSDYRDLRKAGDVAERYAHGVLDHFGEPAES